jgi:hypothetical protein
MKRMSFVSLGALRGFVVNTEPMHTMSPLHKGFTTKDPKRTKGKNHEAHVLCVPLWLPLFAVKSCMAGIRLTTRWMLLIP